MRENETNMRTTDGTGRVEPVETARGAHCRRRANGAGLIAALACACALGVGTGCNSLDRSTVGLDRVDRGRLEYSPEREIANADVERVAAQKPVLYEKTRGAANEDEENPSLSQRFKNIFRLPQSEQEREIEAMNYPDPTETDVRRSGSAVRRVAPSNESVSTTEANSSFWSRLFPSKTSVKSEDEEMEETLGGAASKNARPTAHRQEIPSRATPGVRKIASRGSSSTSKFGVRLAPKRRAWDDPGAIVRQYDQSKFLPSYESVERYYRPGEDAAPVERVASAPNNRLSMGAVSIVPIDRSKDKDLAQVSYIERNLNVREIAKNAGRNGLVSNLLLAQAQSRNPRKTVGANIRQTSGASETAFPAEKTDADELTSELGARSYDWFDADSDEKTDELSSVDDAEVSELEAVETAVEDELVETSEDVQTLDDEEYSDAIDYEDGEISLDDVFDRARRVSSKAAASSAPAAQDERVEETTVAEEPSSAEEPVDDDSASELATDLSTYPVSFPEEVEPISEPLPTPETLAVDAVSSAPERLNSTELANAENLDSSAPAVENAEPLEQTSEVVDALPDASEEAVGIASSALASAPTVENAEPLEQASEVVAPIPAAPEETVGVESSALAAAPTVDDAKLLEQASEINRSTPAPESVVERQTERGETPLTQEEIAWVEQVKGAIGALLLERQTLLSQGKDARACEARLRLLYLVIGEYERSIREIQSDDDPLKLFWEKECRGLETLLQNQLEEIDPTFVAERLRSGYESFAGLCNAQIRKALLATAPACYGLFEERKEPYRPGEVACAYCELDYIASSESTDGFEIKVECRWRWLDKNGDALTPFETQSCCNSSETKLRDVVLNLSAPVPTTFASGDYLLEIEVVDLNAKERRPVVRRLPTVVVADDAQN